MAAVDFRAVRDVLSALTDDLAAVEPPAELDSQFSVVVQAGRDAIAQTEEMARRELAVTFAKVFEQLPDLEITGPPARLRSSFVSGLKRLPARLTDVR